MGQINKDTVTTSGIKVLDRAVLIMLTIAEQPRTLSELAAATDLPRATAHRLATALEAHQLLIRSQDGRWTIGPVLASLGASTATKLIDVAEPIMTALMEATNESVQLYQLSGNVRVCIAAREPGSGLHNTVPVGTRLPLTAGSAARIFLAYNPTLKQHLHPQAENISEEALAHIRKQGWAESMAEREAGLASCSAPVFDHEGQLVAALSISGPIERLKPSPGALWSKQLTTAAKKLSDEL